MKVVCSACSGSIADTFILKIGEEYWHEKCAKCSLCDTPLNDNEKCYEKFGSLFCAKDYFRQFSPHRCFMCSIGVSPNEIVFKLKPDVICHVDCQRCSVCSTKLGQGAKIGVDELGRRLLCAIHVNCKRAPPMAFSEHGIPKREPLGGEFYKSSNSNNAGVGGSVGCSVQSHRSAGDASESLSRCDTIPEEQMIIDGTASACRYVRRRGPRTTIRPSQLDMLNRTFNNTPKPSKHTRAKLALETGLSMRVIQV